MASPLLLPDGMAPSNLHLTPSHKVRYVEGDMFDICRRLAEIDPRLYVVELEKGDKAVWCIMEACNDGVQRQVCKVDALDARCLEKVRYMLFVPFEHRIAALEKENEQWEADQQDAELEQIYDRMGGEFRRQLWHDGFVEHRDVSYPKLGVAAPGRVR